MEIVQKSSLQMRDTDADEVPETRSDSLLKEIVGQESNFVLSLLIGEAACPAWPSIDFSSAAELARSIA